MRVLALNSGSSSLKFQVVDADPDAEELEPEGAVARGSVESIGEDATLELEVEGRSERGGVDAPDTERAVRAVLTRLSGESGHAAEGRLLDTVEAVGHRVVHGGPRLTGPARIDGDVLAELEAVEPLAPLHNAAALAGVEAVREALGERVPAVAVFDTSFFHELPERAATYAIPSELTERHGIRRFGFHGISHAYLAERYARIARRAPSDPAIITLHLGNGCSATAIRGGRPLDTSMGFTPLEGLVMGTRSGDLDPAIVGFIARQERVGVEEVEEWLNHRSGLLGLSGRSNDMREVLEAEAAGNPRARLAVEVFCHRARKYIGAYLTALGGAEAVVFSGAIGERSPEVRARICEDLGWCGLCLDPTRNAAAVSVEARISIDDGELRAYVIPTREELWIARETARCLAEYP